MNITNKHKKNIMISNKYSRGEDYMDTIEGYDDLEIKDEQKHNDYGETREFTMRIFPDPDW